MRTKCTHVVATPAYPLPPLLPKPNSGHRTALGAKRAHTLCFGRHPGFKFIHEWRKRSAHRTDKAKTKTQSAPATQQTSNIGGVDYKMIQKMINESVNNALRENGLVMESSEKSNEIFSFKVGKHVFEGKVTKIKKLS
jgi:hypothetical protein